MYSLYIVLFLHQTTTLTGEQCCFIGCISYYSYIKPQPLWSNTQPKHVVYRTIPTSNHNCGQSPPPCFLLYIVLFLHQTTTLRRLYGGPISCISYYSYIKPQLEDDSDILILSCISYYSYIKPQHGGIAYGSFKVVYRTIPTSNHNGTT